MSDPFPHSSPFDLRPRRAETTLRLVWVFPYAPAPAGRPLPSLRCWLELPGVGVCDLALAVDTGADLSLVDGTFAAAHGFDPTQGALRVEPIRGVSGVSTAYVHRVGCILGPPDDPRRLALEIAFTDPEAPAPPLNVLGRQGFLDAFDIALRNYLLPPCLYLAPRQR